MKDQDSITKTSNALKHLPCGTCGELRCTEPTHEYPQRDSDGELISATPESIAA
jgi:hypothetical protein